MDLRPFLPPVHHAAMRPGDGYGSTALRAQWPSAPNGEGAVRVEGKPRGWFRAALLLLLIACAGCEYYDRPNRPVPEDFKAVLLTGKVIDRHALKGRPWVVALWVPG